jgi:hypothetical protein
LAAWALTEEGSVIGLIAMPDTSMHLSEGTPYEYKTAKLFSVPPVYGTYLHVTELDVEQRKLALLPPKDKGRLDTATTFTDAVVPPDDRLVVADLLETSAGIIRDYPEGMRDGSVAWRVADAGLLLRRAIEKKHTTGTEIEGFNCRTGLGALLPDNDDAEPVA